MLMIRFSIPLDIPPDNVLRPLLPEQNNYSYNLRNRTHNFNLSSQHDSRNFIDRVLSAITMSANLFNCNRFIFTFTYLLLFYCHINSCVLMRSVIIVIKNVCMYVLFQQLPYAAQTDNRWRTSLAAVSGIKTAVARDAELLLANVSPPILFWLWYVFMFRLIIVSLLWIVSSLTVTAFVNNANDNFMLSI